MALKTIGINLTPLGHMGEFDPAWLKATAQQAERVGFDVFWCGDHVIMHNPILDVMTILATIGAVTERLHVGTGIYLLPLRHPVATAKQVVSLDVLTQGRFRFGVGVGGEIPAEFAAVNVPVSERGRRADEGLEIITRVLSEAQVTYQGKYYQLQDVTLTPRPRQQPYPPIWVGGRSKAAMRRAARFGQGWMGYMNNPQQAREARQTLDEMAPQYGRRPSDIDATVLMNMAIAKDYETAKRMASEELSCRYNMPFDKLVDRYCLLGTTEQCMEKLQPYLETGLSGIDFGFCCQNAELSDQLEQFAEGMLPHLR